MKLIVQETKKLLGSGQTLAVLLTALIVGIVLTVFDGVSILGEPANARNVETVSNLYTGTIFLAWIFPPLLGALLVTSEFRLGTAISTFLLTPRRSVVLVAKMVVGALGGALTAIASLTGAYLTAWAIVQTAPESVAPLSHQLIGAIVGLVTTGAALGALGVAVGTLVRAQIASLAILLAWLLFVEGMLVSIIGEAGALLPGQLVIPAVLAPGDITWFTEAFAGGISPLLGVLGIFAWAAVIGLIASLTTLRRDID